MSIGSTTKGFWLGKYEVTQGEWTAVMGSNPSQFDGKQDNNAKGLATSRFPVDKISWNDCQKLLKKLNAREGQPKIFGQAGRFVLPREDEWDTPIAAVRGTHSHFTSGAS